MSFGSTKVHSHAPVHLSRLTAQPVTQSRDVTIRQFLRIVNSGFIWPIKKRISIQLIYRFFSENYLHALHSEATKFGYYYT